jgi:hypothetical protein
LLRDNKRASQLIERIHYSRAHNLLEGRKQGWSQGENLGGEVCRFYIGGEPGEDVSPGAEALVRLWRATT